MHGYRKNCSLPIECDLNEVGNLGTLGALERKIVTYIGTKYKYKSFQRIECKTRPSSQSLK